MIFTMNPRVALVRTGLGQSGLGHTVRIQIQKQLCQTGLGQIG